MSNSNTYFTSNGFSLLELVLAILLSTILVVMFVRVYLLAKNCYLQQRKLIAVQQNMRFAYSALDVNISMAGYVGCANLADLIAVEVGDGVNHDFTYNNTIRGFDSLNAPSNLINKIKPHTDGILIKTASKNITYLRSDIRKGIRYMLVERNPATAANTLVVLSDCQHAELLRVKNYTGNQVELYSSVLHNYSKLSSSMASFSETAYFIAYTGRHTSNHEKIYGLYRQINGGNKQELLDGIDDMQIWYGVAKNKIGKVEHYYRLVQMNDSEMWKHVKSLRVRLHFVAAPSSMEYMSFYSVLRERL